LTNGIGRNHPSVNKKIVPLWLSGQTSPPASKESLV
jgi:hypothetical protein